MRFILVFLVGVVLVGGGAAAIVLSILVATQGSKSPLPPTVAAQKAASGPCGTQLCCPQCGLVEVRQVIDGDTLESSVGRMRAYGFDTPERNERCYPEATARMLELLGVGEMRVEAGPRTRDPNGRILAYLFTRAGSSIDEIMVREGLAEAWRRDGQHRDHLVAIESLARREGAGCLWAG